jgi:hypothetical protein
MRHEFGAVIGKIHLHARREKFGKLLHFGRTRFAVATALADGASRMPTAAAGRPSTRACKDVTVAAQLHAGHVAQAARASRRDSPAAKYFELLTVVNVL